MKPVFTFLVTLVLSSLVVAAPIPSDAAIADVSSATARKLHIVNLTPVHPIDGTESQNSVEARQLAIDDKFFNLDHVSEGKRAVPRRVKARQLAIDDKFFNLDHVSEGKREELKGRPLISVDKSFDLNHVYGGKRAAVRVVSED